MNSKWVFVRFTVYAEERGEKRKQRKKGKKNNKKIKVAYVPRWVLLVHASCNNLSFFFLNTKKNPPIFFRVDQFFLSSPSLLKKSKNARKNLNGDALKDVFQS